MRFTIPTIFMAAAGLGLALDGANAAVLQARALGFGSKASVSAQCKTAVMGLFTSPLNPCLNLGAVVPLVSLSPSASIIPPVTTFLTGLCAAPACAEADIRSSMAKVSDACTAELASSPFNGTALADKAVQFLPILKQVLCLKDTESTATPANGTLCVTTTLQTIQDAVLAGKPLSRDSLKTVLPALLFGSDSTPGIDKIRALGCSACARAAEKIIADNMPEGPTKAILESKLKNPKCSADKPVGGDDGDNGGDDGAGSEDPGADGPPADEDPSAQEPIPAPSKRDLEKRGLVRRSPVANFFHTMLGMLW